VHLDRVVDAHAEHDRQARDRDDRQGDAEVAGQAERPGDADEDDEQRQQPPPHPEQQHEDDDHDADGDGAQGEHAAPQIVVEVLEQHRGAGGGGRRAGERLGLDDLLDPLAGGALALQRLVADQAGDGLGVGLVREERPQRLAYLAPVVEQQEVDPLGVVELVGARDRADAAERGRRVLQPGGLALGRRLAGAGVEQGLAGDALGDVVGGVGRPGHHVLGELQRGERADDGEDAVDAAQVLVDLLHVGDVLRREQFGDREALVHGEQADHRLTAEQILVGDAVLVDLLVLVEVGVLPGGEVEPGDAEPEDERDRQADDPDDPGVLAEVQAHPGPDASHGDHRPFPESGPSRGSGGGMRTLVVSPG
jgi:hypothetical protein